MSDLYLSNIARNTDVMNGQIRALTKAVKDLANIMAENNEGGIPLPDYCWVVMNGDTPETVYLSENDIPLDIDRNNIVQIPFYA